MTGRTDSTDLPLVNPIQDQLTLIHCFCDDVFVTAMSPDAESIEFSTYLGAAFRDQGRAIALGPDGGVYIAGVTRSENDFPLVNPAQSTFGGDISDLFVAKLDIESPAIVYSTYLGGSHGEVVNGLVVDAEGRAIVAGSTGSPDFPTTAGSYQPDYAGEIDGCPAGLGVDRNCYDAFVTAVAPNGGSFAFGTFFGGSSDDEARDVTVDANGRIHLAGYTYSDDFPPDGIDTSGEIFAATLSSDASELENRYTFESISSNAGHGIAIDSDGNTVLTGAVNAASDLWVIRYSDEQQDVAYDVNGDQTVNVLDLLMLLGAWGPCAENSACSMDFDGSGAVDVPDLLALLGAWDG